MKNAESELQNALDELQKVSSPYYQHPGENPGMGLVTPPLNG